eukprot:m51a1_g11612 hypothetical protein (125) ;mRNA; r:8660-10532
MSIRVAAQEADVNRMTLTKYLVIHEHPAEDVMKDTVIRESAAIVSDHLTSLNSLVKKLDDEKEKQRKWRQESCLKVDPTIANHMTFETIMAKSKLNQKLLAIKELKANDLHAEAEKPVTSCPKC